MLQLDGNSLTILLQAMGVFQIECHGCGLTINHDAAISRQDGLYCTERCADRSTAPMIKTTLSGEKYGGMDI
jgi:hypothetical protein